MQLIHTGFGLVSRKDRNPLVARRAKQARDGKVNRQEHSEENKKKGFEASSKRPSICLTHFFLEFVGYYSLDMDLRREEKAKSRSSDKVGDRSGISFQVLGLDSVDTRAIETGVSGGLSAMSVTL